MASAAAAFVAGSSSASSSEGQKSGGIGGAESAILEDLASLVPQYNYWPVGSDKSENQQIGFADGGDLDNTGLLGMLARSDATSIVVGYNAEIPLGSTESYSVEGDMENDLANSDFTSIQ
ncbi:MAG: hypothetical protein COA42_22915 [Alteromonadaceae bacterium]|nr:MAG: hypothetical protein COA42_22915 [Alteromonadaceae bacterium]